MYNFKTIEQKWQKKWDEKKAFVVKQDSKGFEQVQVSPSKNRERKKKFYNLVMFPYPSGAGLHMGHALNYTIADIYARFKRMLGFNVLNPMGYDALGLPAENAAIKNKTHPEDYTKKSIKNFMMQQKRLGLSYDWSRMVNTSSPDYYKWDQWIFLKMFEKGLAYQKEASVNWCPSCKTVLANEQAQTGSCERCKTKVEIKTLKQWFFRITDYADELLDKLDDLDWPQRTKTMQKNWIGKSYGTEIDFEIETSNREDKISKIILLHGKNNTSKDGWYPWFVNKIKEKNIECFSPDFPNTESPFLDEWLEELNKLNPDENTILVGHSRGGVAIMRWLERLPKDKKVKKVILISSNSGKPNRKGRTGESNGFYGTEYNFEKIKTHCNNFVIIHSRDDPIVPFSVGKNNAESLEADFKVYEDKKHFGKDYTFEIPELLEEILSKQKFPIFTTRPDTIYGVTFMVISAQHPKLMQLVTDEQEKEVKNFLEKLKGVSEKQLGDMEVSGTKSQDSHSGDVVRKQGVFTGSYAINPVTKEKIPIWAGNFVVADYGSGMVMAVPAHDQRDFEFAKKYGIAIKKVIVSKKSRYCVIEKSLPKNKIKELKSFWDVEIEFVDKDWGEFIIVYPNQKNEEALKEFLKKNLLKKSKETVGWYTNSEEVAIFNNKIISISKDFDEFKEYGRSLGIPEDQLDLDMKKAHINTGKLINSDKFNGLDNEKAKEEITKFLIKKKLGRKKVQYKLRDWLISRQRYWGTPIPIVYCDKCGVVAVPEKDLPVKLPKKVKFGEGNPLETNEKWINTKCPKCGGNARRETDTMDTFVNSSWYFLRYCDPHNDKMIFDKKKVDYWCPVDQYIGGAEHACMHLIYFRFYTKFLRDIGVIDFDEPALKLFHQGMLHGPDGEKMSKSRGNVIDPLDMVKTHGTDSLRLALMSFASPDSDTDWDEKVLIGSFKFLNKIYSSFGKLNFSKKPNPKLESKLNKIIKEVTNQIENFKYNLAIIKIRELFNLIFLEDEVSKEVFEKSLKLLHPFCPHITEELWEKLSNKKFISLEKWPKAEETKIDDKFEKQEKAIEKLIKDIVNLNKILETKGDKKNKVYVYVLPNEKEFYSEREISRKTGKEVKIFAVNDKDKYDPENKSKKVKLGRPGIYLE